MPVIRGTYPYDSRPLAGELRIYSTRKFISPLWGASFHFDERTLPGGVTMGIVTERDQVNTQEDALLLAEKKGFRSVERE